MIDYSKLVWAKCNEGRYREHTVYGSWVIHSWLDHEFYCFYHCEGAVNDRLRLAERFSMAPYVPSSGHTCKEFSGDEIIVYCCQVSTLDEVFRIIETVQQEARDAFRAAVAEMA